METENMYKLLRNKEIIAILDGDTKFGDYEFEDGTSVKIAMPYLSGPDLCALSSLFGLPVSYSWGGTNQSRWQYLDDLLKYCIKNDKCSDLLSYMVEKERFRGILKGRSANEINEAHAKIVETVFERISGLLYFGGHELVTVGTTIVVHEIGTKVSVSAPKIKTIDHNYVRTMSERALNDIEQGNFDTAITHSRTLLEETFCHVLEKKALTPSTSGNMNELYKQVRGAYNMHTDANADKRINTLLSGLNNIVSAISEMRNKDSDAHGVGTARINIKEHHARLIVNSAMTMADFILSVSDNET